MRQQGREDYIDVLKGIGICLVVIGHVYWPPVSSVIYIFHMPLFFLIGGYLYRASPEISAFTIRKARQLLVPYLTFLICIGGPMLISCLMRQGTTEAAGLTRDLILGGERLVGPLGVFWFPTCYFFSLVIYNALVAYLTRVQLDICILALLALAYINAQFAPGLWLPWALNVCAMAIPMMHIGARLREHAGTMDRVGIILVVFLSIGVMLYAVLVVYGDAETMAMKRAQYGIPIMTLCAAVAATLVLAFFARLVANATLLARPLIILGEASLVIMFLHQPIQMFITTAGLHNAAFRTIAAIGLSALAFYLFQKFRLTNLLFLGRMRHRPPLRVKTAMTDRDEPA